MPIGRLGAVRVRAVSFNATAGRVLSAPQVTSAGGAFAGLPVTIWVQSRVPGVGGSNEALAVSGALTNADGTVVGHLSVTSSTTAWAGLVPYFTDLLVSGDLDPQYTGQTLTAYIGGRGATTPDLANVPVGTNISSVTPNLFDYASIQFVVQSPASAGSGSGAGSSGGAGSSVGTSGTGGGASSGGTGSGGAPSGGGSSGAQATFTLAINAPDAVNPGDVPSVTATVNQTSGSGTPWTLTGLWMLGAVQVGTWNPQTGSGSASGVAVMSDGGISAANAGRQLTAVFTLSWQGGSTSRTVYITVNRPAAGGSTAGGGVGTGGTGGNGTNTTQVPWYQRLTPADYVAGAVGLTAAAVLVGVMAAGGRGYAPAEALRPEEVA